MNNIRKGDLIHIPQGVFLVAPGSAPCLKTDRPRTAIFLGSSKWKGLLPALVFLDGKEFMVRSDHIYLLKEQEKKSNVS